MALSVHTRSILRLITQLVNSDLDGETLSTEEDVRDLAQAHAFSPPLRITRDDVAGLRSLRVRLRTALAEADSNTTAEVVAGAPDRLTARAAQLANELFKETQTLPQLQKHDHWDWHLHAVPNEAGITVRTGADIAIALADTVIDGETSRIGTCAASGCGALFLDLSRNRSKRFCDRGNCANRTHVAAYRVRQAL